MLERDILEKLAIPDPELAEVGKSRPVLSSTQPTSVVIVKKDSGAQNKCVPCMHSEKEYLKENPLGETPWHDIPKLKEASLASNKEQEKILGQAPEGIDETTAHIEMSDGHQSLIRIIRPSKASGGPLIVLIHGGGFTIGSSIQMVGPARPLVDLYGAVVVSISYRLAPEHPFPRGPMDAWESLKWIAANAASLGADTSQGFVLGGTSAGALTSAVIAQKAADEDLEPALTGLWLNIPPIFELSVDSKVSIVPEQYREHFISRTQDGPKDSVILNYDNMLAVERLWKPDYTSPWYSPFNSKTAHQGIPRTFFQACGGDPLRDDTLIYEDVLRENGVKTQIILYAGQPHAFGAVFPFLEMSRRFRMELAKGFAWLLEREVSDEEVETIVTKHPQVGTD